jgi:transposase InsO family protein
MPWRSFSTMSLRLEFVQQALSQGSNIRALCRSFDVSAKTAYKWLTRYEQAGPEALADQSRRPHKRSPWQTSLEVEERIIALRGEHPDWGARKLRRRLQVLGGLTALPAPSTITAILHRHHLIAPEESQKHQPWQRFEAIAPNDLWQMDFKGDFPLGCGLQCYPLTTLDDHSRFSLVLKACTDERRETVQAHLVDTFRQYGLPLAILSDNGGPWGTCGQEGLTGYTKLGVWLLQLGVRLVHSRVRHPQTLGKDERFHQSLKREVLARHPEGFPWPADCQVAFDRWQHVYNYQRPHEALGLAVPAERYRRSERIYPELLPPVVYDTSAMVRRVHDQGEIFFQGKRFRIGRAFCGLDVALRETSTDGYYNIIFATEAIAQINFNEHITKP